MPTDPASIGAGESAHHSVEELIRRRLSDALGGWRGSAETALPTIAFVVAWTWRKDVVTAVVAAAVLAVALAAVRLVQRQSLQFVLSAVVPTAIAAFFVLRSGRAQDAFLPGILWNCALTVLGLVSVVTRWPLVGFMVGAGDPQAAQDPLAWHRDSGVVRVCQRLTMVMVGAFVVRVAIMAPLYAAGQVTWLGVAKVVLGWPLWLAAVAVMGWMLLRGHTPQQRPAVSTPDAGHSAPRGTR